MTDDHLTGGCRCGNVRFQSAAPPVHLSYCHCEDCRRATGAPLSAFVGFARDKIEFEGEDALAWYGKPPVSRSFCRRCGSPVAYVDSRLDNRIWFMLGAMDEPERFPPTVHGYTREQLPFLHMNDGLPRIERTTVPRPQGDKK